MLFNAVTYLTFSTFFYSIVTGEPFQTKRVFGAYTKFQILVSLMRFFLTIVYETLSRTHQSEQHIDTAIGTRAWSHIFQNGQLIHDGVH